MMTLLASTYDQSRFLKAEDLAAEKKFRIKNVTEEIVGTDKDKEKKLVVWFTNDSRGLVLNKTNNRTIRKAFGDPVEGWKDHHRLSDPGRISRHHEAGAAGAHSDTEAAEAAGGSGSAATVAVIWKRCGGSA